MFLTPSRKIVEIGYFLVITAAILGGLADVLPKNILENHSNSNTPILMAGLMFLINGVFFTFVIQIYNKSQKKNKPIISYKNLFKNSRKSFYFLFFAGLIEIVATVVFYFGLRETSAANSAILGNADILFTWLFAFLIFHECIKRKELFPIFLILSGSILLPIFGDSILKEIKFSSFVRGDLFVVFSGVFYGIEMILLKYISSKINAARIIEIISYIGGITALSVGFIVERSLEFNSDEYTIIGAAGIFGIGISILFMVLAIQRIGSIRTIVIFSTTTIFGIIFAYFYLREEISPVQGISCAIVFVGIYLLRKKLN